MAQKIAQWMDEGGVVDVSSKEAVDKSLSLVWHAIHETFNGYVVVKDRLVKACRILNAMSEDKKNGTIDQSDTNWAVALKKMDEILGQRDSASIFWDSRVKPLKTLNHGRTDSPPPELAMELKTVMEDTLDIVQTTGRSVKRLDKMLHSLFGPLGG